MSDDPRFLTTTLTGARTPPAGLLPRLRAIHPRAELVDAGPEWWLGLVIPNPYRRAMGARLLRRASGEAEPDWETERLARLLLADFTLVATYPAADGGMVEDFRRRCWQHDHEPEADAMLARLREAALPVAERRERRRLRWEQLARERAGEIGRFLRHAVSVQTPTVGG